MDAIVYVSNTGFTQKYARILSDETGIPFYDLIAAKKQVKKGSHIVFLGWIMGGKIMGYKKAKHRYKIDCVAGVGMDSPKNETGEYLKKKNRIKTTPTYYLQGGFNINRLTGIYSVLMRNMLKSLQMQKNKSKEDIVFQKTIARGFDNVNVKNLQLVLYEINQAKSNEEQ